MGTAGKGESPLGVNITGMCRKLDSGEKRANKKQAGKKKNQSQGFLPHINIEFKNMFGDYKGHKICQAQKHFSLMVSLKSCNIYNLNIKGDELKLKTLH